MSKSATSVVNVRWMIRRDMPSVLDIESTAFEFPWNQDDFIRCLRNSCCIGMVAEIDEQIAGFMVYELHKNRITLLNFSVAEQVKRTGVGRSMVDKLVGKLASNSRTMIEVLVRESNLAAQLFFRSLRFRAVDVIKDNYVDTKEDAYRFVYWLH